MLIGTTAGLINVCIALLLSPETHGRESAPISKFADETVHRRRIAGGAPWGLAR